MSDVEASPATTSEKQERGRCCNPKRICLGLAALILVITAVSGITYGVLSPRKPRFSIDDVSFNSFNISHQPDPPSLNSNVMVTLSSMNPNSKIGVYYGKLGIYLTLADILMTGTVFLDNTLQQPGESTVWTVALTAGDKDAGSALAGEVKSGQTLCGLGSDRGLRLTNGLMAGTVRMDGWVQWKVGSVMTTKFGFHVNCPVTLMVNDQSSGAGEEVKSKLVNQRCSIHL